MNKIIKVSLITLTLLVVLCVSVALARNFSDVPTSHWSYMYVNNLSDRGVIKGYDNGTFNPSGKITKAEYIKLLVSSVASTKEEEDILASTSSYANWFDPYVNYAKERNLLLKDYSVDELKSNVSRKEMAQLLAKFANYVGLTLETGDIDISKATVEGELPSGKKEISEKELREAYGVEEGEEVIIANNLDELVTPLSEVQGKVEDEAEPNNNRNSDLYTDISTLGAEERAAVEFVSNIGLISGYDDGSFKPENEMTRAEVATIIYRFSESFNKQDVKVLD